MKIGLLLFYCKKIISSFLLPFPFFLIMGIIGLVFLWFSKKQKTGKILVTIALICFWVFSCRFVVSFFLHPLELRYPPITTQADGNHIKHIVVLSGGVCRDLGLPFTLQPNRFTLSRLVEGIRMYKMFPDCKLILSGSPSEYNGFSDAEIMARNAMLLGVKWNDILLDTHSLDTVDQARNLQPILEKTPFLLVTSAVHMQRSMLLFEKLGMNPIPVPGGYDIPRRLEVNPFELFPDPGNMDKLDDALHEYTGILWEKLNRKI